MSLEEGQYKFVKQIGSGGCSQVWLAEEIQSGKNFAIKIINTTEVPEKLWRREIEITMIVRGLDHANLLKYEGYFRNGPNLYIVMEYVDHLDVGQCIGEKKFSPKLVANIFFQVIDAILTLKDNGVMYRDLKPDNIVFSPCDRDRYRVKLIDFSHSVICKTNRRATQCGTPCYVSPEIAQGRYYGVDQANIFPLGVICHELLTRKLPFDEGKTNLDYVYSIRHGDFKLQIDGLNDVCQKFIKDVLIRRRPKRLELVLEHPFIQKYCKFTRKSRYLPKLHLRLAKRKRKLDENSFKTPTKKKRKLD